jgi:hypothetical protein
MGGIIPCIRREPPSAPRPLILPREGADRRSDAGARLLIASTSKFYTALLVAGPNRLVGGEALAAGGVVEAPEQRLQDRPRLRGELPVGLARLLAPISARAGIAGRTLVAPDGPAMTQRSPLVHFVAEPGPPAAIPGRGGLLGGWVGPVKF